MSRSVFRISTAGLPAYIRSVLIANDKMAKRAMVRVKHVLVKGGRKRAPKLNGALVRSITGSVEHYAKSWAAFAYVPVNSKAAQYAVPMHEHYYNLGKKSQAKQAKQPETVGRLYLQRSVDEQRPLILAIVKDEIRKTSYPT